MAYRKCKCKYDHTLSQFYTKFKTKNDLFKENYAGYLVVLSSMKKTKGSFIIQKTPTLSLAKRPDTSMKVPSILLFPTGMKIMTRP